MMDTKQKHTLFALAAFVAGVCVLCRRRSSKLGALPDGQKILRTQKELTEIWDGGENGDVSDDIYFRDNVAVFSGRLRQAAKDAGVDLPAESSKKKDIRAAFRVLKSLDGGGLWRNNGGTTQSRQKQKISEYIFKDTDALKDLGDDEILQPFKETKDKSLLAVEQYVGGETWRYPGLPDKIEGFYWFDKSQLYDGVPSNRATIIALNKIREEKYNYTLPERFPYPLNVDNFIIGANHRITGPIDPFHEWLAVDKDGNFIRDENGRIYDVNEHPKGDIDNE